MLANQSSRSYGENPTMMSRAKLVCFFGRGLGGQGSKEMRELTVCSEEEEASACRYLRGFMNDLVPRFSHVEFQCAHPRQVIYHYQQARSPTAIRHISFYILWVYQYSTMHQIKSCTVGKKCQESLSQCQSQYSGQMTQSDFENPSSKHSSKYNK